MILVIYTTLTKELTFRHLERSKVEIARHMPCIVGFILLKKMVILERYLKQDGFVLIERSYVGLVLIERSHVG